MSITKFKTKFYISVITCMLVSVLHLLFANKTNADGWNMGPPPVGTPNDFDLSLMNITNWVLGFIASIAVLALIWGGISYIASAGNEQMAENAKKTIQYAIIGIIIAGMAYAIINVIVSVILV